VTRLLVINGPPGIGKTTVARVIANRRAPMLLLDVDHIRSLIVGWEAMPQEAGILARSMVADMASTYLRSGGDVVVSQAFGRLPGVEQLEAVAAAEGATLVHVVLMTDLDDARQRFVTRGGTAVEDLQSADGSLAGFDALYAGVTDVLAQRPDAIPIRPTLDDLDSTVLAVSRAAGWA
jgi:predicted kinase